MIIAFFGSDGQQAVLLQQQMFWYCWTGVMMKLTLLPTLQSPQAFVDKRSRCKERRYSVKCQ